MEIGDELYLTVSTPCELSDLAALGDEFRRHLGQSEPTRADFARSFQRLLADGASEFYIARNAGGNAIGYLQCRFRYSAWTSGWDAELEDVFVSAASRRQGPLRFGVRIGQVILDWWASGGPNLVRAWAGLSLALGALIAHAVAPNTGRRPMTG